MATAITRRTALAAAGALVVSPASATANESVDLQLVLAVDTSGSVTPRRFDLQRDGYANAFRLPDVQRAILSGKSGAVAIVMTHWTGQFLQRIAVPWTRLSSPAACLAFADAIDLAPRQLYAGGTSISGAIDHARDLLRQCPFKGPSRGQLRRVIDVSGDGENNRGRPPDHARDDAAAQDITINGLPILAIEPELDAYYRDHVIGGTAAFVLPTESFERFGEAVRRNLIQEIA
jgi:Protein of unknown function (DUF1194)